MKNIASIFPFDALPNELKVQIFLYLNVIELSRTSRVSKSWLLLTSVESFWKILLQKDFPHHKLKNTQENQSYRNIYRLAEQQDYQHKKVIYGDSTFKPFLPHEKALFRSVKGGDLNSFNIILDQHYPALTNLVRLFLLMDAYSFSIFHWLGKLNRQVLQDHLFGKILLLWKKLYPNAHTQEDYIKVSEECPMSIIQLAAACNQVSFLKGLDKNIITTPPEYYLQTPHVGLHPLIMACHLNSYDVVVFLVEQGIDAKKITNEIAGNCLSVAAHCGDERLLTYLIALGIFINKVDAHAKTPLMYAIENENVNAVRVLLEAGADPNIHSNRIEGNSLWLAFKQQNPTLIHLLLDNELIKVEASCLIRESSLFSNFNQEILEKLFRHVSKKYYSENTQTIDYNKTDDLNNTIVHWHAFCNVTDGLEAYPQALLNQRNRLDLTPLYLAAQQNNLAVTQALLQLGAMNNETCYYQKTPFFIAVEKGYLELVNYYLSLPDTDVNLFNQHGSTPLRKACENGHLAIVQSILKSNRADINTSNLLFVTPLRAAAQKGDIEIVAELLLQPDINVRLISPNDKTALSDAKVNGHEACAKLIELFDYQLDTALLLQGNDIDLQEEIVRFLVQRNKELNFNNLKTNIIATINNIGFIKFNNPKTKSDLITQELIHNLQTNNYEFDNLVSVLRKAFDNLIENKFFDHNLKAIGQLIRALAVKKLELDLKSLQKQPQSKSLKS